MLEATVRLMDFEVFAHTAHSCLQSYPHIVGFNKQVHCFKHVTGRETALLVTVRRYPTVAILILAGISFNRDATALGLFHFRHLEF